VRDLAKAQRLLDLVRELGLRTSVADFTQVENRSAASTVRVDPALCSFRSVGQALRRVRRFVFDVATTRPTRLARAAHRILQKAVETDLIYSASGYLQVEIMTGRSPLSGGHEDGRS